MAETTSGLETDAVITGEKTHNKFQNLTLKIPGSGRGRKGRFPLWWKQGNMKKVVQSG